MDEKSDLIRVFCIYRTENSPFAEKTAHAQKQSRRRYPKIWIKLPKTTFTRYLFNWISFPQCKKPNTFQ